jgi:hypothetical protein
VVGVLIAVFLPEIRRGLHLDKPPSTIGPAASVPPQNDAPVPVPPPTSHQEPPDKATPPKKKTPAPDIHVNSAPNGIIVDGGTAINPTVNNFGPPPLPTPTVTICALPSVPDGQKFATTLKLKTDGKIVQPFYAFFFDKPVLNGSAAMDGHKFGATNGRADKLPNPERSYVFRVTSIDFGTNVWTLGEEIKATVPSDQPIRLVNLLYGGGDDPLAENLVYRCD